MQTTDRLKVETSWKSGQEKKGEGLGLYWQIFICHPTCLVVLQCWETPGMYVGVVGYGIRMERKTILSNYFVVNVIPKLNVHMLTYVWCFDANCVPVLLIFCCVMSKDVFHVVVAQGPQGPDGPLGEPGPEGTKVNMHTTLWKTSPCECENGIDIVL